LLAAISTSRPPGESGHEPPRLARAVVTGVTPIAAATAHGWGGRSGPKAAIGQARSGETTTAAGTIAD